jgi:hypothetical protein
MISGYLYRNNNQTLLKWLYQARKMSRHVYVLGVSMLPLSTGFQATLLLKCLYQARKVNCHVEVSILSLSMIYRLDFGTILKVCYFLFVISCIRRSDWMILEYETCTLKVLRQ